MAEQAASGARVREDASSPASGLPMGAPVADWISPLPAPTEPSSGVRTAPVHTDQESTSMVNPPGAVK
jgi:hypothetical protein